MQRGFPVTPNTYSTLLDYMEAGMADGVHFPWRSSTSDLNFASKWSLGNDGSCWVYELKPKNPEWVISAPASGLDYGESEYFHPNGIAPDEIVRGIKFVKGVPVEIVNRPAPFSKLPLGALPSPNTSFPTDSPRLPNLLPNLRHWARDLEQWLRGHPGFSPDEHADMDILEDYGRGRGFPKYPVADPRSGNPPPFPGPTGGGLPPVLVLP
jgi:hypothetical protein